MMTRTVVVLDHPFPNLDTERRILDAVGARVDDVQAGTEAERIAACRQADAVLLRRSPLPRQVIEAMERCTIICNYGAGYDNIDVAAATERGIMVAPTSGYADEEVADHALTLFLALARRLVPQVRSMIDASSNQGDVSWSHEPFVPIRRLAGQTLGIVGLGRIGRRLAEKALGIGLRVVASDPVVAPDVAERLGIRMVELEELLCQADFISIHAPLLAETRHLIGPSQLALMKPTAYLINCARGPLVDQEALLEALRAGRLAGAGLDVLEGEPPTSAALAELLAAPNVIVTPHVAWYSEDALADRQRIAAETVARALRGERPDSVVNAVGPGV